MSQDIDELVPVLETRDKGTIATAESLLAGSGIRYTVSNTFSQDIPLPGAIGAMRVMVNAEDADAAQHILRGFQSIDQSSEQPFAIRLLLAIAVLLVPLILAIVYSLRN